MSDDLTELLDGLADDARAAARLGTGADIRRRARRHTQRVFLGAGTLTAAAVALAVAVASAVTGGPAPASTGSPSPVVSSTPSRISTPPPSFPPDPAVYHSEAWLPAADAPMASHYQWTFQIHGVGSGSGMAVHDMAVIPVCGSQTVGASSMDGVTQLANYRPAAGNGGWAVVTEMLHFLPSSQDAATTYSRLLPDLARCLGGTSGFAGTDVSAGFTAHTANGFGWFQQYRFQTASMSTPRMAAQYMLVARRGSLIAVFSAAATWALGDHGPVYDTSGDQQALDSLVAHLAVYSDATSSPNASGS